MTAIDTHCHLDLVHSMGGLTPTESLERAHTAGVRAVVQIATALQSSQFGQQLDREHNQNDSPRPRLYWTAGLHPESAEKYPQELDAIFQIIRNNYQSQYFLGVGETGLDYFHSLDAVEQQKESFARHLDLAHELNLPVVLHLRDSRMYMPDQTQTVQDALKMVRARPGLRGVLHCFTYSYEEARPFVDLGWYVSYSGILTFKNARTLQASAVQLPLETLLVETDSPFLSPAPFRGKSCEPAYVTHTLDFLTQLRQRELGEEPAHIRATILNNCEQFLNWKNR